MDALPYEPARPSGLRLLLEHFSRIEDKRSPESVAHKLNEVLLVCVCATIAECDSFEAVSDWGNGHLEFLRRFLPFNWGIPSGRWLNIMMNRIDPDLFAACFMDWVRACWPEPLEAIAIDGKTVRRSHDRARGRAALHLVSAFATNSRLVLGQEAVDDKTSETTAIPVLLEKLAAGRSLEGAVVSIDAIACNPQIAQSIRAVGADYHLAAKATSRPCRPTSRPPSRPQTWARSRSTSISTRATAASKPAPSQCCGRPTGSTATGDFPAKSDFPTRARSSGSKRGPSSRTARGSTPAITSHPALVPPPRSARPSAATGA